MSILRVLFIIGLLAGAGLACTGLAHAAPCPEFEKALADIEAAVNTPAP